MQARNCKERILKLKEKRLDEGLTVDQCVELCNGFPSDSTIRKVYAKGSEEKSYRESTIAAIELAVLGEVYKPGIAIPVEDVIKAQRENAQAAAQENRRQALQIEQQKANLRVRDYIFVAFFLYQAAILVYDRLMQTTGFYNTNSKIVWGIQAAALVVLAAILAGHAIRSKKRSKEINKLGSENQQ